MNGPDAQLRAVAACKCVAETVLEVHHLTAQPKTRFSNKSVIRNRAQYQSLHGPTGVLGHTAVQHVMAVLKRENENVQMDQLEAENALQGAISLLSTVPPRLVLE